MEKAGMNKNLFDRTVGVLSRALDYRVRNQRIISTNVANIDTPGFRPKQLKFDEELRRAVGNENMSLAKTNGKHLPGFNESGLQGAPSFDLESEGTSKLGDNSLDIDKEMAKMAKNNLLYEATVKMLSKKFDLLKTAIEGRG
ncbi:MAG: flagellar basal body rod protein FlgB [Desulfatiglandaceae bacterium]|jgi:flagellar basal-body rod protein FlgB